MKSVVAWVVLVAGALLAATGFWWLWTGLDIVQVERGWSAVIAGATMLSAGLVMAALSVLAFRLNEIAFHLQRSGTAPFAPAGQSNREMDNGANGKIASVSAGPSVPIPPESTYEHGGDEPGHTEAEVESFRAPSRSPGPPAPSASGQDVFVPQPAASARSDVLPVPKPARASPAQAAGAARPDDDVTHEGAEVVGRHESGDTTYVMYADGSIEAQTPEGALRFSSVEDLRNYVDNQAG